MSSVAHDDERRLRERIATLEELLDMQEQLVAEQSEKLEAQAAELRRSNGALEQFAYVISHDLQEPLRMVSAYSELLRQKYRERLDETANTYIDFASGGAQRMQQLINALLEYSRITTRPQPLRPVQLDRVVEVALQNLSIAIDEAGAKVVRGPLPRVMGDDVQLVQLVQNLVANALKFRRETGPVEIRIEGRDGRGLVELVVADNGIGIDPRHHQRIFDVFKRIHPKKYKGTGIGLSICQRIAERHDGRIWVESEAGKGASFHITLRLAEGTS